MITRPTWLATPSIALSRPERVTLDGGADLSVDSTCVLLTPIAEVPPVPLTLLTGMTQSLDRQLDSIIMNASLHVLDEEK
jgi:hypothetical protein